MKRPGAESKYAPVISIKFLILIILGYSGPAVFSGPAFCEPITENVFLVIIDGLRSDEAFSYRDVSFDNHPYIPVLWSELRPIGTLYSDVYNLNFTSTMAGHTQLITGNPCNYPNYSWPKQYLRVRHDDPTIFEYFRNQTGAPPERIYAITGKEMLVRLGYSMNPIFKREDGITLVYPADDSSDRAVWETLATAMDEQQPTLVFVNLQDVDEYGHPGVWEDYIHSIGYADSLMGELWSKIESDPVYAGKTTLLITTDHGRHSDVPYCLGFMHHGGLCMGCRKTFLLAIGPDTPAGVAISVPVDQMDICNTIGGLLGFNTPLSRGRILWDILGISDPPEPELRRYRPQLIADGGHICRAYIEDSGEEYRVCVDRSFDNGVTWFGKTILAASPWMIKSPLLSYARAELRVGWQEMVNLERYDLFSRSSKDMGATWGVKEEVHRCHHEFSHLDVIKPIAKIIDSPFCLASQTAGPVMIEAFNNWTIFMHRPRELSSDWNAIAAGFSTYFVRDLSADFIGETGIITAYSDLSKVDFTSGNQKRNYEIQIAMGELEERRWTPSIRVTSDTCSSIQPVILVKDENEALLVWADNREDGLLQLYSHRINPRTREIFEIRKITESPFGAWQPAGLYDRLTGNYYFVWSDSRTGENNIHFGFSNGVSDWETGTLEYSGRYSQNPTITLDEVTGVKYAAWEDISEDGDWSLKCARIPDGLWPALSQD